MSRHLYVRPIPPDGVALSYSFKCILERLAGDFQESVDCNMNRTDIPRLQVIAAVTLNEEVKKDALELIDMIEKFGELELREL